MTAQPDILGALAAPFPADAISWRVGSTNKDKTQGMALAYIDARDVQDRLDAVCGLDWQVRHPWSVGTKLACEIGIRLDGEWIWRGDGAGDSDVEAEKGAFSDSFKRAAVRWGVGRYLYDLKSPWVAIEPMGKSYKIVESEKSKLRALLTRSAAPSAPPKANGHSAGSTAQRKPLPGKFELLFPNGEIMAKLDDPEQWFDSLRRELKMKDASVAGLWGQNRPTAEALRDMYPDVQWPDAKGNKFHAYEFVAATVAKLLPGIAP